MAKMIGLLAFAGDKVSARIGMVADVTSAAERSEKSGDRSVIVDTLSALSGTARTVRAVRLVLSTLGECLKARQQARQGVSTAVDTARSAAQLRQVADADGGVPARDSAASFAGDVLAMVAGDTFGGAVGYAFAMCVDTIIEGMAKAAKDKRDSKPVAGVDVAGAAVAGAAVTGVDWPARVATQRARTLRAVALARAARADLRKSNDLCDTLQGELATLRAECEALRAVSTMKADKPARKVRQSVALAA